MKIECLCILLAVLFLFPSYSSGDHQVISPYCSHVTKVQSYPFTAIIYGDTRGQHDLEVWRSSSDYIRKLVPTQIAQDKPDLIINTGDLNLSGSDKDAWAEFDKNHDEIRKNNIPFFPVLGNHEYWGKNKKALAQYFNHFPDIFAQRWYSFQVLGIVFIILDSNYDQLEDYEIAAQERWLEFQLSQAQQNPSIRQVIVADHHPPYTNTRTHGSSKWLHPTVVPLLAKFSKAQLMFSAHCHTYEHLYQGHTHFIVSAGGGAPLFSPKELKKNLYKDLYTGSERHYHYCCLTFAENQVEVKVKMLRPGTNQWFIAETYTVVYPPITTDH